MPESRPAISVICAVVSRLPPFGGFGGLGGSPVPRVGNALSRRLQPATAFCPGVATRVPARTFDAGWRSGIRLAGHRLIGETARVTRPDARSEDRSMDRDQDADRDDRRADTALSFAQREAWLHARLAADVPAGNETVAFGCPHDLDVAALQAAFADLLRRHAAWRTSVGVQDGRPVAVVAVPGPVYLPEIDLRGAPDADAEARAQARADAMRPFDLEHGPLYRTLLTRLEQGHRLYLTVHRTIADRVSLDRLFLPELAALYAARTTRSAPPPEPALQYGDFAARQHAWLETAGAEPPLDRWRRRLAGPPATLEPFTDRARPPLRGFRGARHPLALGPGLTAGLRAAARAAGADLFAALLAGFAALLHRYTGEDDVVVGTLADGRAAPALRGLLGCFDNPLALRLDLGDDPSFRVLLARARDAAREALA